MLVYIALLRIKTFLDPVGYQIKSEDGYLNEVLFGFLTSPLSQSIIAVIFIFIQALIINRVGIKNKINKEFGLLPGAMFALFICMIPYSAALTPLLVANTFIILSLQSIFTTYNKKEVSKAIFYSGFFASIASLFYFPFLYFFFITTIGLMIMRSFTLKERLQHLIGWVVPYALIYVWHFWIDYPQMILPDYFKNQYALLNIGLMGTFKGLIFSIVALFMIIYFLAKYIAFSSKKDITVQKKIDIFYWVLLYGGLSIFFYNFVTIDHFITIALPVGYLLAMGFVGMKNKVYPEIIHLLMIGVVIYFSFY